MGSLTTPMEFLRPTDHFMDELEAKVRLFEAIARNNNGSKTANDIAAEVIALLELLLR